MCGIIEKDNLGQSNMPKMVNTRGNYTTKFLVKIQRYGRVDFLALQLLLPLDWDIEDPDQAREKKK